MAAQQTETAPEMAVDTPARIAVLGAGPIGLEAALYARYLGYEVQVFERGHVAENVRRWGHVRLFTPWSMNCTSLGLQALWCQDSDWQPPPDDALLTGRQFAETYLLPLARSDLLVDSVNERTQVVAVGRDALLKGELAGEAVRGDDDFRLLVRTAEGDERYERADVVIDATGTYGHHNWLGPGGIPALGEQALADRIQYGLPDVLGGERERYADRHVLVVGAGYSAATSVVALAELARAAPATRVTWVTRLEGEPDGPIRLLAADRLAQRDQLARAANALARQTDGPVAFRGETCVEALHGESATGPMRVELGGRHSGPIEVDAVIANVGYRPDNSLYAELQVHECYASGGPMRLALALAGKSSADCLDQAPSGAQALMTTEPNFYILGMKSYGRDSRFLLRLGHEQVRELFSVIGDRPELDLYATWSRVRR